MWNNTVDALRSSTVGEVRLAADLEQKYCSTQDTSVAATHHHAPPSQAHTWTTPLPLSTVSHPPVSASPYSAPPQPCPSQPLPWSSPYYYPPPTTYPQSTQFPPSPPSEADTTLSILPAYSQVLHIPPGPPPSRSIIPAQQTTLQSDAVQSMAIHQHPRQPELAAGMYVLLQYFPCVAVYLL